MRNTAGKKGFGLVWCWYSDVADAKQVAWCPILTAAFVRFPEAIAGLRFKVKCFLFSIAEARNGFKFEAVFGIKI